jgi:pyruvate kinase
MAKIAEEAERNIDYKAWFRTHKFIIKNASDAISHATCGMAVDINAKVIVVCTMSGMTARMVSRFRAPTDIIGMTTTEKAWRKLALSWGVTPALAEEFPSTEVLFYHAKNYAKKELKLNRGDTIVITGGVTGKSGTTNLIKVETI